jgi:Tol biopolymer transport system component/DNA-binding CsgD family transcriptional regulator
MKRRGRPPYPDILTPREWEVLDLLRAGLTNDQIASQLGISLQGAKFHVSEILGKLQLPDRRAAAAWQPPERRRVALVLAPLLFVPRRIAAIARWRTSQLALVVGSAVITATVLGAIAAASILMLRSHASPKATPPASGALEIGDNIDLPLLLDGDRLALSTLDGATPAAFTPPGSYTGVRFDAQGQIEYIELSGAKPGFYRVEDGTPHLLVAGTFTSPYPSAAAASWSPDARRAAWVDRGSTLHIADTTGAALARLDDVAGFLWSPDSARVMAWNGSQHNVRILDTRTNTTTASTAHPPLAWSSLGDVVWLDVTRGDRASVVLAHEDGTAARNLGATRVPPEAAVPTPAFSPDGRYVAFGSADAQNRPQGIAIFDTWTGAKVDARCPICVVSVFSGYIWPPNGVTDAEIHAAVGDANLLTLSPDGSHVAYTRLNAARTGSDIYTRSLADGPETRVVQVTDTRPLDGQMAWSPDGSQLIVPLQAAESTNTYTLDPAIGALRNLGVDAPLTIPAVVAPDGSAFYAGLGSVLSLADGHVLVHAPGSVTGWSPDSKQVLSAQFGLFTLDVTNGQREDLLLEGNVQDAAWSPDGRTIAFIRDQRLNLLDVASGKTKTLASGIVAMSASNFLGDGYLAWSSDGTKIAVGDWQPNGTNGKAQLFIVDTTTGAKRQATKAAAAYRYYAFSPDGNRLAFVDLGANTATIADLRTGALVTFPVRDGATVAWVSDTQIVTSTVDGIVLASVDGTTRPLVANTGGCQRFLLGWASPHLIFSSICTHSGL